MSMLTVCMPSHRDFRGSWKAIETALAYCSERDAQLVISDNSGDVAKASYWKSQSQPRLTYLVMPSDTDIDTNYISSLLPARTPFVLQMGDDDALHLHPRETPFDLRSLPADFIGVHPLTEVWSTTHGLRRVKDFAITAETPSARVLQYSDLSGGDNAAFYSIFRREPYIALMQFFLRHHPTRGGYCDWAKMLALVSYGRMAHDPGTVFRYNIDRWYSRNLVASNTSSLFEAAGLPGDSAKFHYLLMFLDVYVFAAIKGTPLDRFQAMDLMAVMAGPILNAFLAEMKKAPSQYGETVHYLAGMVTPEVDPETRFQIGLMIADTIKPGLKDAYVASYRAAIAGE